jgi:flagellar biosynthesis anti-sigma factor FlgM
MKHNERHPRGSQPTPGGQDCLAQPQPETCPSEGAGETSETMRLMELAQQIINETPDVRAERVAALKRAIEEGEYQVDSRQLANIILAKILAGTE